MIAHHKIPCWACSYVCYVGWELGLRTDMWGRVWELIMQRTTNFDVYCLELNEGFIEMADMPLLALKEWSIEELMTVVLSPRFVGKLLVGPTGCSSASCDLCISGSDCKSHSGLWLKLSAAKKQITAGSILARPLCVTVALGWRSFS